MARLILMLPETSVMASSRFASLWPDAVALGAEVVGPQIPSATDVTRPGASAVCRHVQAL